MLQLKRWDWEHNCVHKTYQQIYPIPFVLKKTPILKDAKNKDTAFIAVIHIFSKFLFVYQTSEVVAVLIFTTIFSADFIVS